MLVEQKEKASFQLLISVKHTTKNGSFLFKVYYNYITIFDKKETFTTVGNIIFLYLQMVFNFKCEMYEF